jgi:hypothetical protein
VRCTIRSEEARRVLAQAIWEAAASHFDGDLFFFALIDFSWTFVHPAYAGELDGTKPSEALSELLAILDRTRSAGDRLAAAAIGETVELPLKPEELTEHLGRVESRMQQEPFPQLPIDDQKDVLLCVDAARGLREALIRSG